MAGFLLPLPQLIVTQPFDGADSHEPHLWFQDWHGKPLLALESDFPGADGDRLHYHGGVDYRAAIGTPLKALAAGKVAAVYTAPNGSKVVKVAVNPRCVYSFWHLSKAAPGIKVGVAVKAGQVIAYSGSSGTTAAHLHVGLRITDTDIDGKARAYLYDPTVFYVGASLASSPAIISS